MATVIIPNNTNNCISKVAERTSQFRKNYLFLGSLQATHPQIVKEYKIIAILTVGSGLEIQKSQGISHKVISIEDNVFENIAQYFSECNEWISKHLQKGNVLVHCRAGISRSASVVLAYTMKTKKVKLSTALQLIKEARSMIKPNEGFVGQLKEYQRKLLRAIQAKKLKLK